ncbi:MAG: RsmD family RNA methyltransferase [Trueperaceae bacterium]
MPKPRIIGGTAHARPIDTPRRGTRPSPSRLREALFDILAFHEPGPFLDLYSGSGAIGLEAASRGWQATCVDLSREAAAVIARNARNLGLQVEVVRGDALAFAGNRDGFEVVFAAPPYPLDLEEIFTAILTAGPARSGGLYVFQHPSNLELSIPGRLKRYGSNSLTMVDAAATDQTSAGAPAVD